MKYWFYSFFVFFMVSVLPCQAQSDLEDVIYLKNGGLIRGTILEMHPDSIVKIQSRDLNISVYPFQDINKIVKETRQVPPKQDKPVDNKPINKYESKVTYIQLSSEEDQHQRNTQPDFTSSGYYGILKFGPMGLKGFNINIINGYQFNPYVSLGLGVGVDSYKGIGNSILFNSNSNSGLNEITEYFVPVFLDFRFHTSKSRTTFLTFLNMGYSVNAHSSNDDIDYQSQTTTSYYYSYDYPDIYKVSKGGTFFSGGIGLKIAVSKHISVVTDFTLKFQTYEAMTYKYENVNNAPYSPYGNSQTYRYVNKGYTNKLAVSPVINVGIQVTLPVSH